MLRLRGVTSRLPRLLHGSTAIQDQVMDHLRVCSADDQVLDVVGRHKAKLTLDHVGCAVGMLWNFQKEKPDLLRTLDFTRSHPQFMTLRVLAEIKIEQMDDQMLVDTFYHFLRLGVDYHDSLIQQLISEAWLRVDRLHMRSLSKFAVCLNKLGLHHSPLMGHIANILAENLSSIKESRILTTLMVSTASVVSPRLRDALIAKAEELLDKMDTSNYNNAHRVLQFLRLNKRSPQPLLDKCTHILLFNVPRMDAGLLTMICNLFQSMGYRSSDFDQAVIQRLIELMDSSTDPSSFTKVFETLAPMASAEIREQLESTALLLANEFNASQALVVAEGLEKSHSRNLTLLNKIASVIQRNLDDYQPVEVARIAQALYLLQYKNPELFTTLRNLLLQSVQRCVIPHEVITLTRVLSVLPSPRMEEAVKSRLEAVMSQCNLYNLHIISLAVAKWIESDPSIRHNISSKYVGLLRTLNQCGRERLQTTQRLDLLLEQLRFLPGEWFEQTLLQETKVTLLRMADQINSACVPDLAKFLTRIGYLCPPLMDRIASVIIDDIDQIHVSSMYSCLLPFVVLCYDPPQAEMFYETCIEHIISNLSSFEPYTLVFVAYNLAITDRFPEAIIREIFTIDFLRKLNSVLETFPNSLNTRTRFRLMGLNRAACLDCPEFQVPWFHDNFLKQVVKKGSGSVSPVQQQIHKMLGEVLGGMNYVKLGVITSYYYNIDFECVLDKNMQPLPYTDLNTLHISEEGTVHSGASSPIKQELPPGAQRVALEFLDWKSFPRNSRFLSGEAMMRKRHLEILGYRVVQIPHFEWNSMEFSTPDAWKEYLKKKIFNKDS